MTAIRSIVVGRHSYEVTFERRIVGSQRDVIATAFDEHATAVAIQQMNTAAAKGYLERDTSAAPPNWDELEDIATGLLRARLEE